MTTRKTVRARRAERKAERDAVRDRVLDSWPSYKQPMQEYFASLQPDPAIVEQAVTVMMKIVRIRRERRGVSERLRQAKRFESAVAKLHSHGMPVTAREALAVLHEEAKEFVANLENRGTQQGRPHSWLADELARRCYRAYKILVGRTPARSKETKDRKHDVVDVDSGPFIEFVKRVFGIYGIPANFASAANCAKKAIAFYRAAEK